MEEKIVSSVNRESWLSVADIALRAGVHPNTVRENCVKREPNEAKILRERTGKIRIDPEYAAERLGVDVNTLLTEQVTVTNSSVNNGEEYWKNKFLAQVEKTEEIQRENAERMNDILHHTVDTFNDSVKELNSTLKNQISGAYLEKLIPEMQNKGLLNGGEGENIVETQTPLKRDVTKPEKKTGIFGWLFGA